MSMSLKVVLTYKNELLDWSLKIFGSHYFVLNISLSSNLCIVFCQFKKKLIFFHFLDIFSLLLLWNSPFTCLCPFLVGKQFQFL